MNKFITPIFFLIFIFFNCAFILNTAFGNATSQFIVKRVAHAGGEINGKNYTNSLEALNFNRMRGFDYFEIDLAFTSDGHLVCLHDWGKSFRNIFGFNTPKKITLENFNFLIENKPKYRPCTLASLIRWMESNKNTTIITDVKGNNIKALTDISKKVHNFQRRIIPQIYDPKNYKLIKALGYQQIIWTLYRYKKNTNNVLKWVNSFKGPIAVTMPIKRAKSGLSEKLQKQKIPTYVHTINNYTYFKEILQKKYFVNEIYTDKLAP